MTSSSLCRITIEGCHIFFCLSPAAVCSQGIIKKVSLDTSYTARGSTPPRTGNIIILLQVLEKFNPVVADPFFIVRGHHNWVGLIKL